MDENLEENVICTVCRIDLTDKNELEFGGAPLCKECFDSMGIDGLNLSVEDKVLEEIIDPSGIGSLKAFTAIAETMPPQFGWNMLALMEEIGKDMDEEEGKNLVEASSIIAGSSMIRNGKGEGEPDNGRLMLMLVLGQVMDLSIMKNIVNERDLTTSQDLDEMKLIGYHQKVLFDLVAAMEHNEEDHKKNILINCIGNILMVKRSL